MFKLRKITTLYVKCKANTKGRQQLLGFRESTVETTDLFSLPEANTPLRATRL